MPSNNSIRITLVFLLACALPGPLSGCKWCPPELGPTILKRLDASSAAVLAELIRKADSDSNSKSCQYRIVTVLKGGDGIRVGDCFEVPLNDQGPLGSQHLFFSDEANPAWNDPLGVSPTARMFLCSAAGLPGLSEPMHLDDRVRRLVFALPFHTGF